MEKLVVTRRKGGSFESRSPQAYPLQHGYALQREKGNWHGVGIPLERRGKWPAAQHKEVQSSKQAPIGWHTLRRSLATLLISNGEHNRNVVTPTPKITLELYAEAVSADQQRAHKKVVQMVLLAKFPEKLKARSAAPTS